MQNDTNPILNTEENNTEEVNHSDYEFLNGKNSTQSGSEAVTDKFDMAFSKSSKAIQDYILSEKFEENIRLICKIEKLDEDKSNIIIENIAVAILVGLLPITEAKTTLIESFKTSGILIEDFTAGMVLKNIDAYILSDIRKQIIQSKTESNKEIRHLTLRESTEETEKEELRKILLEKTGNITGKGEVFVQYKDRDNNIKKEPEINNNQKINRDSLLETMNLKNISNTDKIKERMAQIKKEEEERIGKLNEEQKEKRDIYEERERNTNNGIKEEINTENTEENNEDNSKEISKIFAKTLEEKISEEENKKDSDILKQERERQNSLVKSQNPNYYAKEIENNSSDTPVAFDPYRESI
ncbi:MAG: hypothetical protein WCO35_03620 [Candidatus Nomurabacteria bacterium]